MPAVPLFELENLHITRNRGGTTEHLVRNLSLRLDAGESLGLVGESGSGKSLTALALLRLLPEPEIRASQGSIRFAGHDILNARPSAMNDLRGSRMAVIFQDALGSLNPVRLVEKQLAEVFRFHRRPYSAEHTRLCLQRAGFHDIDAVLAAYPHELSGGMRQRLLLAMALLLEPELLIADEPTTALDVTLQARWVDHIQALRREEKLGLLFISHDIGLVADVCERVAVLYRGHLVETGTTAELLEHPLHPYTKAMLRAETLTEKNASSVSGCPFAPLCPLARPICQQSMPILSGSSSHRVACHAVTS